MPHSITLLRTLLQGSNLGEATQLSRTALSFKNSSMLNSDIKIAPAFFGLMWPALFKVS